ASGDDRPAVPPAVGPGLLGHAYPAPRSRGEREDERAPVRQLVQPAGVDVPPSLAQTVQPLRGLGGNGVRVGRQRPPPRVPGGGSDHSGSDHSGSDHIGRPHHVTPRSAAYRTGTGSTPRTTACTSYSASSCSADRLAISSRESCRSTVVSGTPRSSLSTAAATRTGPRPVLSC